MIVVKRLCKFENSFPKRLPSGLSITFDVAPMIGFMPVYEDWDSAAKDYPDITTDDVVVVMERKQ